MRVFEGLLLIVAGCLMALLLARHDQPWFSAAAIAVALFGSYTAMAS